MLGLPTSQHLVLLQRIAREWFTVVRREVHEESRFAWRRHGAAAPQAKKVADGGLRMAKLASGWIFARTQGVSPGMPAFPVYRPRWEPELKATPKPHQCDIKATPKPVDSQLIGTLTPPQSHPNATPMRPQSHPKATSRLRQGSNKATEPLTAVVGVATTSRCRTAAGGEKTATSKSAKPPPEDCFKPRQTTALRVSLSAVARFRALATAVILGADV